MPLIQLPADGNPIAPAEYPPAQVACGHAPVEADHGEVIGHEIACPVQRGDQYDVGPDPGREVRVPGVRQHTGVQQAHRDVHHGAAEREV